MISRAWISTSEVWGWKFDRHLVDEDLRVGKRHVLFLRAAGQEQGAHGHGDADGSIVCTLGSMNCNGV